MLRCRIWPQRRREKQSHTGRAVYARFCHVVRQRKPRRGKNRLEVIEHGMHLHPGFSIQQCMDDQGKKMILAFMNAADLSIKDIRIGDRVFCFNIKLIPLLPMLRSFHVTTSMPQQTTLQQKYMN
jgi:hypothetical protein